MLNHTTKKTQTNAVVYFKILRYALLALLYISSLFAIATGLSVLGVSLFTLPFGIGFFSSLAGVGLLSAGCFILGATMYEHFKPEKLGSDDVTKAIFGVGGLTGIALIPTLFLPVIHFLLIPLLALSPFLLGISLTKYRYDHSYKPAKFIQHSTLYTQLSNEEKKECYEQEKKKNEENLKRLSFYRNNSVEIDFQHKVTRYALN